MECKLQSVKMNCFDQISYRFEGLESISRDGGSKKVEIFPNIDGKHPERAIILWCNREAKVRDVIGLTCLKYIHEKRPHNLQPPITNYDLFMCEEDGTVDNDFPALDWKV